MGVGGQKCQNLVNVVCERPLTIMNESGKKIYSENPEQQSTLGTVAYLSASGAETLVLESILEVFLPCLVKVS